MSKAKRLIVLAMACMMLFGSTLAVNAACAHPGAGPGSHNYHYAIMCSTCGMVLRCDTCGIVNGVKV